MDDAGAGPLIARLTDYSAVIQPGPYSRKQLDALVRVCNQAERFRAIYPRFGVPEHKTAATRPPATAKPDPVLEARYSANFDKFQNEVVRFQAFQLRCSVAEMNGASAIAAEPGFADHMNDSVNVGAVKTRGYIVLINLLELMPQPFWSAPNRQILFDTFDATAKPVAQGLQPQLRDQLVQWARISQARLAAPDTHKLDTFIATASTQECGALCKAQPFDFKHHPISLNK